jgi:hypothetical protein
MASKSAASQSSHRGKHLSFALTTTQADELATETARVSSALAREGYTPAEIDRLLQVDLYDMYERRSAIDPYEQLRAELIIRRAFPDIDMPAGLGPWTVTVGDPKLRLRPRDLHKFDPYKVLRRWNLGIAKLRELNLDIRGYAVVELGLTRPLERPGSDEARFVYEPHFHGTIWGATREQIVAAFKVRKSPSVSVRKRPVKVQPVYDLNGLLNYHSKFSPRYKVQYLHVSDTGETALRWRTSRIPEERKAEWYAVMSHYRVDQLLSATGDLLRDLRLAQVAELVLPRKGKR